MLFPSSELKFEFRRVERKIPLCSFLFVPMSSRWNVKLLQYCTTLHSRRKSSPCPLPREPRISHLFLKSSLSSTSGLQTHACVGEINSKVSVDPLCSKCNDYRLKLGRNTGRILWGTLCNKSKDHGLKLSSNVAAIMTSAVCNYCNSASIISHSHTVHYIKSLIKTCKTQ